MSGPRKQKDARCRFPLAGSGWGSDDAALDAARDSQDLQVVISFSCPGRCCTCALNCSTSDFRLVTCPASIPICPWIPSSRGARAQLIAATVAFASDERRKGGATGVIVLQGACTTARAEDVADLAACSRRSKEQSFFESVELQALSTPGLLLQGSSCSHGSCADSSSAAGVAVSGSRYRKGVNSGSSSVGEQDTLRLAVPLPQPLSRRQYSATNRKFTIPHKANFLALAPQPPLSLGLTGWFWARRGVSGKGNTTGYINTSG